MGSRPTSLLFLGTGDVPLPPLASSSVDESGLFSVSIHGCDHTAGEFGTTSLEVLQRPAELAQSRMRNHQARTGIQHDSVMVFPQGVFSSVMPRSSQAQQLSCGSKYRDPSRGFPRCPDANQGCLGRRHHDIRRFSDFHAEVRFPWIGELRLRPSSWESPA